MIVPNHAALIIYDKPSLHLVRTQIRKMSDAQQILRDLLNNIAIEHGYENYNTELKSFSTGGANYTSQLYRIILCAPGKKDLKLFAKVAFLSESIRDKSPFRLYETEMFFYSDLYKRYQDMEFQHNVPMEHRLTTAKFYGCNKEYLNEIIVLEDLSNSGFQLHDRMKSYTWEYASKSVQELAKLHSLSIALLNENPEELDPLYERLKMRANVEHFRSFVQNVTTTTIPIIKEENRGRMESFLENLTNVGVEHFLRPLRRPIIMHGDFRPSNLMHRTREDGQLDVVVLDYQTLQVSNPIVDLMYFIFIGSDEEFRAKHYRQLLEHYYSELTNALTRLGVDASKTYSKEDFEYELKEVQPYGLFMALMLLPMITVDPENAPKMDSAEDFSDLSVKPNEHTAARLNGVIDDFIRWGIL